MDLVIAFLIHEELEGRIQSLTEALSSIVKFITSLAHSIGTTISRSNTTTH